MGINEQVTYIGITNYQSKRIRFGIRAKDRGGHIYCIGKTGVGKSTLLLNMACSDIRNGNGVGVIDPHGDLAQALIQYIPAARKKDLVFFNATDTFDLIAFNPLSDVAPEQRYFVASTIVNTLKKVWSDSWGPRLEHILRNSILTLLEYPDATLLDLQPLLTSIDFRKEVLQYVSSNALLRFWELEFNVLPVALKAEVVSPIINKIGLFQTHPIIRAIIAQKQSAFSISEIMDGKKIFIANLSKGVLGEDGTQLIGSMLVSQFQIASIVRASRQVHERTPFYLYIDEMQSFVTLAFANILSESRKYGLCLFLAHQYMEQLAEDIRNAILGNVGTLISFRVGAQDAVILEKEFYPVFTQEDLITLPQHHIYLKLMIDGATSRPFSAVTLPLS